MICLEQCESIQYNYSIHGWFGNGKGTPAVSFLLGRKPSAATQIDFTRPHREDGGFAPPRAHPGKVVRLLTHFAVVPK